MNLFDRIVRRTIRERDFCAEWLRERMELIEEARLLRVQRIGVKIGFLDQITYKHYLGAYHREQMQRGTLKSEWKMASA